MKRLLFFSLFFTLVLIQVYAQQSVGYIDTWWKPNGPVNTITNSGNKVYVGGQFTYIGPMNSYGASVDKNTGAPNLNNLHPNGQVNICVSDGVGGWYIGGNFTSFNAVARHFIARINADGTLNSWNPNANGIVSTIVVSGNTVYAGGNFTIIGGQTRNRIAALDTLTGNATAWNPNANANVGQLIANGGLIYVAGSFTNIGGLTRNHIAALDSVTGTATFWSPNPDSTVSSIALSGSSVYVGGRFSNIGGQPRNYFASIDIATGYANSFNPTINNVVDKIFVNNNTLYLCGLFTTINSQPRHLLAAINSSTGIVNSWNPNPDSAVEAMAFDGSSIFVGGKFDMIGGQIRRGIAVLDNSVGQSSTTWMPIANGGNLEVMTLSLNGNNLYAGGNFISLGGVNRTNLAAYDMNTGIPTLWDPSPNSNGSINTICASGNRIYVGGNFNFIGGFVMNNIAALDTFYGNAFFWNPNANGSVSTIVVHGNRVYAGGSFTNIGGQNRNRIAALDTMTGAAMIWNPNANNTVRAIELSGDKIYLGGYFTNLDGTISRNHIASVDTIYGNATPWNPNANNYVYSIYSKGDKIYVGGLFYNVSGQTRNNIACIDSSTGLVTAWNPGTNTLVSVITNDGNKLYCGGGFTSINNQTRNYIASLDLISGTLTSFNPNAGSSSTQINTIKVIGNRIYVGGNFTTMGNYNDYDRRYFMPLFDSTQLSLPVITSISPNTACIGGTVTITGNKFTGATQVRFGGVLASSFTVNSSTSITAIVGNGENGLVSVVTPSGSAVSTDSFFINPPAIISSSGNSLTCNISNVLLNANIGVGYSYQWKLNGSVLNGATNSSYNATIGGTYAVVVTNNNSCSNTSQPKVINYYLPPTATITPADSAYFCSGQNTVLNANLGIGYNYQWLYNGLILTGFTNNNIATNSAGNYAVIITDSNGCASTSSTTNVTVKQTPTVSVTPTGPLSLCQGGSIMLNANAVGNNLTYSWAIYGNNIPGEIYPTHYAASTGIYTVKVTDTTSNCSSISSNVNVTVQPLPVVIINQSGDTLISTNNFVSYQWYLWGVAIQGATNTYYSPSQSGFYFLMITDSNNCNGQSNSFNFTVGIDEVNKNNLLKVSPNPFTESFTVSYPSAIGIITVTDAVGKVIASYQLPVARGSQPTTDHSPLKIDMKGFAAGVYLIKYETVNQSETIKIIKSQ